MAAKKPNTKKATFIAPELKTQRYSALQNLVHARNAGGVKSIILTSSEPSGDVEIYEQKRGGKRGELLYRTEADYFQAEALKVLGFKVTEQEADAEVEATDANS